MLGDCLGAAILANVQADSDSRLLNNPEELVKLPATPRSHGLEDGVTDPSFDSFSHSLFQALNRQKWEELKTLD